MDVAAWLLAEGAPVDAKNNLGSTALHSAAANGHAGGLPEPGASIAPLVTWPRRLSGSPAACAALVDLLLVGAGASATLLNDKGNIPKAEALQRGHEDVARRIDLCRAAAPLAASDPSRQGAPDA